LLSEIGWAKITPKEINIEWCDGLPQDEATEIQNATAKINAGLSTTRRENIERFGLSEDLANEVQSEVEEQRAAAAVYMGLGGGFGGVEEDKVDDEA